jgi:dolichyl-phosphate-mannose-protein mannosyltransferase
VKTAGPAEDQTEAQPFPVEQIGGQAPSDRAARDAARRSTFATVILPAILLLAYLGQCAWFIQTQSFTFDEPTDILAGLELWRTGQYSGGLAMNDHPPLSRLLCTLPAIGARFQVGNKVVPNPEAVAWHNSDFDSFGSILPNPEAVAWHTRPVNALLGAILGVLLWLAARSLYSTNAANFVLALFAFSPSLIAHFSVGALNDGVMALMLFATVFQLCRWHHDRSWIQTALLGLVLGGLLLAKASSLPFFAATIALMLVLKPGSIAIRPVEWNWKPATTALLISFLIVWGAYRFHVSKVTLAASDAQVRVDIPKRTDPIIRQSSRTFQISVPVPAFEFIQGIGYQLRHDKGGHYGFLLGRRYIGGSKLYFPIVVLLKWPTIVLLLFLAAVGLMFLRRTPLPRDFALWAAFPILYFVLVDFAKLNLGERYILPIYPFTLLLCGSLWQFTRDRRAVLALLLGALTLHVGDVMRYAPDYLSYFNLFVSPASSYKLLSDSNVDWGEGLIALRHYQEKRPSTPIHLAYFGNVAPDLYGIRAIPLMPNERVSGTVVISANYLSGQTLPDPNSYHWVLQYPTKLILNHSLYVFEVPDQAKQP